MAFFDSKDHALFLEGKKRHVSFSSIIGSMMESVKKMWTGGLKRIEGPFLVSLRHTPELAGESYQLSKNSRHLEIPGSLPRRITAFESM